MTSPLTPPPGCADRSTHHSTSNISTRSRRNFFLSNIGLSRVGYGIAKIAKPIPLTMEETHHLPLSKSLDYTKLQMRRTLGSGRN
ncbi:hypothetical protein AVEN_164008-1, partial [Araneus ventricosus]